MPYHFVKENLKTPSLHQRPKSEKRRRSVQSKKRKCEFFTSCPSQSEISRTRNKLGKALSAVPQTQESLEETQRGETEPTGRSNVVQRPRTATSKLKESPLLKMAKLEGNNLSSNFEEISKLRNAQPLRNPLQKPTGA